MKLGRFWTLGLALASWSCYDFHTVGPEDPPPLRLPATVSVSVVYLRPSACINTFSACSGTVQFTASWMAIGSSVTLQQTAAHIYSATIPDVPVNYPGADPHRVYAVDPFLRDSPTLGVSADRLTIGGEKVVKFENAGGASEKGLILIDASGQGRTPK
jgi:hypothetical protein